MKTYQVSFCVEVPAENPERAALRAVMAIFAALPPHEDGDPKVQALVEEIEVLGSSAVRVLSENTLLLSSLQSEDKAADGT